MHDKESTVPAASLRHVWAPVRLGSVSIRNRIVLGAHTTNFAEQTGLPGERLREYHLARARDGVGLVISEALRVHPLSRRAGKLSGTAEGAAEAFRLHAEALHGAGAAFIVQLAEPGRSFAGDVFPSVSASPVPWRAGEVTPHELSKAELRDVTTNYGVVGRRMRDAGVDGLEIQIGHGHLINQFLSPISNFRTDEYGGSFDNRLRLAREIFEEVRGACGDDYLIGMRLSATEFASGGLALEDTLAIVDRLVAEFKIDYLHVSQSAYIEVGGSLSKQVPDMYYTPAPYRHHARRFKQAFPRIPVMAVGKVEDLEIAEELLAAGDCDLAVMVRALIADPAIVARAQGRTAPARRRCVYCNQACIGHLETGKAIACVVNPTAGNEYLHRRRSALEPSWGSAEGTGSRGKVLVAGAGPSGLEAAFSLAERGYSVTIREKSSAPGGALRMASLVNGRERWRSLITDQLDRLPDLGVRVEFGVEVSASSCAAEEWLAVVVATGARRIFEPPMLKVSAISLEEAIFSLSAAEAERSAGVVLVDHDGGWATYSLALHLSEKGYGVEIVSSVPRLAWNITVYSHPDLIERLAAARVGTHLGRQVRAYDGKTVIMCDPLSRRQEVVEDVSHLVWIGNCVAEGQVGEELEALPQAPAVFLVGDAMAPRTCHEAVREGHAVAELVDGALQPRAQIMG